MTLRTGPGPAARLYILSHSLHGAVKIGITGLRTREDRVARFRGRGWALFEQLHFTTGADAYRVEQGVIRQLRQEGHTPFLSDAQMPAGGWTETFDAARVPASRLLRLAEASL